MKSPYTGKEMEKVFTKREWTFRGEKYEYFHTAWYCEDTKEYFTTDESDCAGYTQVTNQYRDEYGIPYTDEIIDLRKRYGINAAKMSLILGFGTNQYRLYEQGEVPSVSNGRMIKSINNPKVMLEFVESTKNKLSENEYNCFIEKIKKEIKNKEEFVYQEYEKLRIFKTPRGKENGYARTSTERLKNILLYILNKCGDTWYTKMNKLLFYIDFLSYRNRGVAMTGLSYKAIQYGPVPINWDRIYSEFQEIEQQIKEYDSYSGNLLIAKREPDNTMFTEDEIEIMNHVCERFSEYTSRKISNISHQEKAWKEHINENILIPFDDAFSLNIF